MRAMDEALRQEALGQVEAMLLRQRQPLGLRLEPGLAEREFEDSLKKAASLHEDLKGAIPSEGPERTLVLLRKNLRTRLVLFLTGCGIQKTTAEKIFEQCFST